MISFDNQNLNGITGYIDPFGGEIDENSQYIEPTPNHWLSPTRKIIPTLAFPTEINGAGNEEIVEGWHELNQEFVAEDAHTFFKWRK